MIIASHACLSFDFSCEILSCLQYYNRYYLIMIISNQLLLSIYTGIEHIQIICLMLWVPWQLGQIHSRNIKKIKHHHWQRDNGNDDEWIQQINSLRKIHKWKKEGKKITNIFESKTKVPIKIVAFLLLHTIRCRRHPWLYIFESEINERQTQKGFRFSLYNKNKIKLNRL